MSVLVSAAVVSAVLGGVSGGPVGYFTRSAEYRRDQRLKTYSEFMDTFREHVARAANLQSVAMTWGLPHEGQPNQAKQQAYAMGADDYNEAARAFHDATSRLRLIATVPVREVAEEMVAWVEANVYQAVPFAPDLSKAGSAARTGPGQVVEEIASQLSRFADVGRVDLAEPRWMRRRR